MRKFDLKKIDLKKIILILMLPCFTLAAEKYTLPCPDGLLVASAGIARKQVGTLETGNNSGAIRKYLISVGLKEGNPYCAAGQYYCFKVAADRLGLPYNTIPVPETGLARKFFSHARKYGRKVSFKAEQHDLLIYRKGRTIFGHVERIISVGRAGWVKTIAFNVRGKVDGKEREGVFVKRRNIYHPLSVLRVLGLVGFFQGDEKCKS